MSLEGSTIAVNFFPVIDSIICETTVETIHTAAAAVAADQLPQLKLTVAAAGVQPGGVLVPLQAPLGVVSEEHMRGRVSLGS